VGEQISDRISKGRQKEITAKIPCLARTLLVPEFCSPATSRFQKGLLAMPLIMLMRDQSIGC